MKTLLFAIFISLSTSSLAQDMQLYLTETQQMVREKKYPEALERFVWFHNHSLEHDPSMSAVRLSFALSYWKSLANVYPPALLALKEMRYNKTKAILDSGAALKYFSEVVALNRVLNEVNKSIELFEAIEKQENSKAKSCWVWVKDAVFDEKRYDIVKRYIGTAINEFEKLKSEYELINTLNKKNGLHSENRKALLDSRYAGRFLQLINYSLAVNDLKSAKEIKEKALALIDDKSLRAVKIESCIVAGANKIFRPARALIAGGTVTISSPDVKDPVAVRYAFKDKVAISSWILLQDPVPRPMPF